MRVAVANASILYVRECYCYTIAHKHSANTSCATHVHRTCAQFACNAIIVWRVWRAPRAQLLVRQPRRGGAKIAAADSLAAALAVGRLAAPRLHPLQVAELCRGIEVTRRKLPLIPEMEQQIVTLQSQLEEELSASKDEQAAAMEEAAAVQSQLE